MSMRSRFTLGALAAVMFALAGCKPAAESPPAPVKAADNSPTSAQPKLPALKLWIGSVEMSAEVASSPVQVQTGMMHRKEMGENDGMIFVFARPLQASFWMKNTLMPLSCAYIDSDGVILEIHDLQPLNETSVTAQSNQVRFVLETKQGWFQRNKISPGTVIRSERGTLMATFFRGKKT